MARYSYPQPGNEDEFEEFCVRLYRQSLKRSGLVRYGKRGERQDGIDIIDASSIKPLYAIQCKHHEPTKTIQPKEIEEEIQKAESSIHSIDYYIIATTARKSTEAQNAVIRLNQRESRSFEVIIDFWLEEICTRLGEFPKAIAEFILEGRRIDEELVVPIQQSTSSFVTAGDNVATSTGYLYPEIDALFESRKLEAAEYEINKLADPEKETISNVNQRYAILRLKAKLSIEKQQYEEAARLFVLAYGTCPSLSQAKQNRVLALALTLKHKEAFVEAEGLIRDGIETSILASLLIDNSSGPGDLALHKDFIDKYISSEENVNVSLVNKHLAWDEITPAEDAAKRALTISPNSAHALFARGMVAHHSALRGPWQHRFEHLAEATRYYTEAIHAAENNKYKGLLPEIYFNRGRVNAVIGHRDQAAQDFRKAVQVAAKPSLYAEGAVSFFLHVYDYKSAQEFIQILDATSPETAFFTAVTQYNLVTAAKKRDCVKVLAKLARQKTKRANEARIFSVQWALELKDFPLARRCVTKSFVKREPFIGHTLLGWIEIEAGIPEKSRSHANKALESSSHTAHPQELTLLARLFAQLKEDDIALPLFERAATPGVLDESCKELVNCAQRVNRHDVLLRICNELHQTQQQDSFIRKLEVQLLSNYSPDRALCLAIEYIQYDQSYFSAAKNFLATRLGRMDMVTFDFTNPPNPEDFEPEEASLVVTPYIETSQFQKALDFAYHQLRCNFANEHAHGHYIGLVLKYGQESGIPVSMDTVDGQCAVRLENLTTKDQRWVIVEDRKPDSARNEYACSTKVIQALIGKQVGDDVDLCGATLQPQLERIIEIQSKYIRLYRDAINNFQYRFPGAGTIQLLHLGSEDHFDPAPIIEGLKARREYAEKAMAFYKNNLCSLYLFASRLGLNEREAIVSLSNHEDCVIHCANYSPEQFFEMTKAGFETNTVVMDISAIVSLSRLNAWNQLDSKLNYLVSKATVDRIVEWQHSIETGPQPAGYSFLTENGMFAFQELSQEQIKHDYDEVCAMADTVQKLSVVEDSLAIAALAPQRREEYIQVCGLHTLQSMSLAKERNAVLWTDDLFVGIIAEADFGVRRIWTQLAFKVLHNAKQIDDLSYSLVTAKLMAWNYVASIWNPQDVIAAGSLCDWDVNQWPFQQCIRQIGLCPLHPHKRAMIALEVLRLLRQSACVELRQSTVIQAILNSIGNTHIISSMLQNLDRFFSIDIPTAKYLKLELAYWLRFK